MSRLFLLAKIVLIIHFWLKRLLYKNHFDNYSQTVQTPQYDFNTSTCRFEGQARLSDSPYCNGFSGYYVNNFLKYRTKTHPIAIDHPVKLADHFCFLIQLKYVN